MQREAFERLMGSARNAGYALAANELNKIVVKGFFDNASDFPRSRHATVIGANVYLPNGTLRPAASYYVGEDDGEPVIVDNIAIAKCFPRTPATEVKATMQGLLSDLEKSLEDELQPKPKSEPPKGKWRNERAKHGRKNR